VAKVENNNSLQHHALRQGQPFVAELKLDLLQFASGSMTQA